MLAKILIQDAYRFAQIIPEEGEAADASQLKTGLRLLNDLITEINYTGDLISLISNNTFNLAAGNNNVDLDGYIDVVELFYPLGNVRFMPYRNQAQNYFKSATITNASGMPVNVYAQRTESGITLNVFFNSDRDYLITIWGTKQLPQMTEDTDIIGKDSFYIPYLKRILARELRVYDQLNPLPSLDARIAQMEHKLKRIKVRNTAVNKSRLGKGSSGTDSIPSLVLGRGWRP